MITDCTKSSNGKLLAAVIAMMMVVCVICAVPAFSEDVNAATDTASAVPSNGVLEDDGKYIVLKGTTPEEISIADGSSAILYAEVGSSIKTTVTDGTNGVLGSVTIFTISSYTENADKTYSVVYNPMTGVVTDGKDSKTGEVTTTVVGGGEYSYSGTADISGVTDGILTMDSLTASPITGKIYSAQYGGNIAGGAYTFVADNSGAVCATTNPGVDATITFGTGATAVSVKLTGYVNDSANMELTYASTLTADFTGTADGWDGEIAMVSGSMALKSNTENYISTYGDFAGVLTATTTNQYSALYAPGTSTAAQTIKSTGLTEIIIAEGSANVNITDGTATVVSFNGTVMEDLKFTNTNDLRLVGGSWVDFTTGTPRSTGTLTVSGEMIYAATSAIDMGNIVNNGKLNSGGSSATQTFWGQVTGTGSSIIYSDTVVAKNASIAATGGVTVNNNSATFTVLGTVSSKITVTSGTIQATEDRLTNAENGNINVVDPTYTATDVDGFSYAIRAGFDAVTLNGAITLNGKTSDDAIDPYARTTVDAAGNITAATYTIQSCTTVTVSGDNALTIGANTTLVNNGTIQFAGEGEIVLNAKSEMQNTGAVMNATDGDGFIVQGSDVTDNTPAKEKPVLENIDKGYIGVPVSIENFVTPVVDVYMSGGTIGNWEQNFNASQRVIITEGTTWTIYAGNDVKIDGELVVEGTLVIEEASGVLPAGHLIVGTNGTTTAKVTIDGTVQNYGDLEFLAGTTTVNGSMTSDGTFNVTGSKLVNNGTITISTTGTLETGTDGDLSNDGTMTINGAINGSAAISNSGTVTINNSNAESEMGSLTISLVEAGAVADIQSVLLSGAGSSVTIDDLGAALGSNAKVTAENSVVIGDITSASNKAASAVFSGLTVTSAISGNATNGYAHTMQITGSPAVVMYDANGTALEASASNYVGLTVTVPAENTSAKIKTGVSIPAETTFSVGNGVQFATAGTGVLTVAGTLLQTSSDKVPAIVNGGDGQITVTGLIQGLAPISETAGINAAYYVTQTAATGTTAAVTYYNYATFNKAVADVSAGTNANTSKAITIMGEVTVTENVDVPAPIQVTTASDAEFTIGDDNDVVVTFAAGTRFTNGGTTEVVGTLTFGDKTNDRSNGSIISDVMFEDEARNGSRTYTNIYTALASGSETITVTKEEGYVELEQNVTIPAGVTLVVPDDAVSLWLADGVTMTIDGTLETELDILAESRFSLEPADVANVNQSSAVIVNGTLRSVPATVYGLSSDGTDVAMSAGAPVAGAYYVAGDYNVISSLAIAVANVADIEGSIRINGAVTAGDIVFSGTDDCDTIAVNAGLSADIPTVLTVSTLTLEGDAGLNVSDNANASVNGVISGADATVTAVGVNDLIIGVSDEKLSLVSANIADAKTDSFEITSGTVYSGVTGVNAVVTGPFSIATGATVEVVNGLTFDKLTVNGTLSVPSGKNSTSAAGVLIVNGTVNVTAQTGTSQAGTLSVQNLYVGIDDELKAEAEAAAINGPVSVSGFAIVLDGTAVDATAQETLDDMKSTGYYVEDALWITKYVQKSATTTIDSVDEAPVTNAFFGGVWNDADGEDVSGNVIGTEDAVYAEIEYEVYYIVVLANQAVDDVTIDNNLMQYGLIGNISYGDGVYYGYTAIVSAGNHTINYTLANGYSGNGVLTVNGTQQSGLTFTTEGTPTIDNFDVILDNGALGIQYNLQLSGFEKTGYVPESPDTGSDGDSGMGITDYLLIVLVVLIVVMAIIVAMRLMRS